MQRKNIDKRFIIRLFVGIFFGILLCNVNGCHVEEKNNKTPSITVYGGAGQVSGSLSILETGNARYMIDCGSYYPHGPGDKHKRIRRANRKNRRMPVDPNAIDGVFITHAHLDHIGRLPLLIRNGYDGPIYLTPATSKIARVMLKMRVRNSPVKRTWSVSRERIRESNFSDGLFVTGHWHANCQWNNKIKRRNRIRFTGTLKKLESHLGSKKDARVDVSPCKECAGKEVSSIRPRFKLVRHGSTVNPGQDVRVTFRDAGHIPGASSIVFETNINEDPKKIIFSGDLGNRMSTLQPGPSPLTDADLVVVESTYGPKRKNMKDEIVRKRFRRMVGRTVENGGIAMIPAFALNRTQKVLHELVLGREEGTIPEETPIYCPSPTAEAISTLYRKQRRKGWFRKNIMTNPLAFDPAELIEKNSLPEEIPTPSILITTGGMLDKVYSIRILPEIIEQPDNSVFLVSWQAPHSTGRALKEGKQKIKINGERVPVNAGVHSFSCFSGHGDATDIDRWLRNVPKTTPLILVHGDKEKLRGRAEQLRQMNYKKVKIAKPQEKIHLKKLFHKKEINTSK